ncbi:conserved hypothetical protein [Ricinus communis]|uniref:Cytochrome P450 n=1 Tax=Ricinus communis TaxID=3988 RepID=B9R9F8_RICCO|nr:conserved hypothetical protein [Ricinus communis]
MKFMLFGQFIQRNKKRHIDNDTSRYDFLDVYLANGFQDGRINWLVLQQFTAGIDTTTTTIERAMAELFRNREVLKKVRQELDREINKIR